MDPTQTPTEEAPDLDYTAPIHHPNEQAFAAVIRNRSGVDAGEIDLVLRDLSGLTDLDQIDVVSLLWTLYRAACRQTGETPRQMPNAPTAHLNHQRQRIAMLRAALEEVVGLTAQDPPAGVSPDPSSRLGLAGMTAFTALAEDDK